MPFWLGRAVANEGEEKMQQVARKIKDLAEFVCAGTHLSHFRRTARRKCIQEGKRKRDGLPAQGRGKDYGYREKEGRL